MPSELLSLFRYLHFFPTESNNIHVFLIKLSVTFFFILLGATWLFHFFLISLFAKIDYLWWKDLFTMNYSKTSFYLVHFVNTLFLKDLIYFFTFITCLVVCVAMVIGWIDSFLDYISFLVRLTCSYVMSVV